MESRLNTLRCKPNGDRISQEEIAAAIGCSRNWVVKAEKGRLGRTAELMIRLSKYLNVDLRDIFLV
jgi:DNA-binding XRE family transcriptional regulator